MTRITRLFAAALLALPSSAQPPTVITSESRVVLVDTVVTDKKGASVRGLTGKDFKVFEDNREQTITSFSVESAAQENSTPRHTVLFFDNSTAGPGGAFAREAAVKFIDSMAGPRSLIAIAEFTTSLSVTQNFTSDAERLKHSVVSARVPGARTSSMPAAAQAAQENYAIGNALGALQTVIRGISTIPGRKAVIFISSGYPDNATTRAEIAATIRACGKADVAIYPVGSSINQLHGELPTGGTFESPPATGNNAGMRTALRNGLSLDETSSGAQQSLGTLAAGTGGFMILNTGDIGAGFKKVGEEEQQYYLLGYTPSGEAHAGACHTLKVRLEKTGDIVRSRPGYCEAASIDALSGTPTERDLEAKLNSGAKADISGAQMQVPFFYTGTDTARVTLALEIPPGSIPFARDKGKFHAVVNVVGIVSREDGSPKSRFSDSVNLEFDDKRQVDEFDGKPFHYEKQFPMLSGTYTLKVVFSAAANRFGRVDAPLTIEPWKPAVFSLSGLALGVTTRAADTIAGVDTDLVEDRVPMVAGGLEIVATGSNVLRKSTKSFVYAEVYEPALAVAGAKEADIPAVGIRMELLDAASGKVKKDFGLTRLRLPALTGKPAIPVGLVLTAPDLEPGLYRLRVTALDAKNHAASRSVDLRLE